MPKPVTHQGTKKRALQATRVTREFVDVSTSRHENGDSQRTPVPKAVSLYMAEIGRKGGQIGGKQRLQTMTPEERKSGAQKAARARWEKQDELERED